MSARHATSLLLLAGIVGAVGAQAATGGCQSVIVSNEASGDLSVVDPRALKVTTSINVGKRPRGLALSQDGSLLYVALSGSPAGGPGVDESKLPPPDKQADGIGIVDLRTHQLLRVLRGVSDPERIALSADGRRMFVSSEDQGMLVAYDLGSESIVARTAVGDEPEGIDLEPGSGRLFVTSEAGQHVAVMSADGAHLIGQVQTGLRPRSTAFSPDGHIAYVANEAGASITEIDTHDLRATQEFKMPTPGQLPMRVLASPDGGRLYVSTGRGQTVVALDSHDGHAIGAVESGARPWGLALSPDGSEIYSANGPSNDVSIIEADSMTVRAKVSVGAKPWDVICRP